MFIFNSYHTYRSAYGALILYLILLQHFFYLSNIKLPAFCLIYISVTLLIDSGQNVFYIEPFNPSKSCLIPCVVTMVHFEQVYSYAHMKSHGIIQCSSLICLLSQRNRGTVTFRILLLLSNLLPITHSYLVPVCQATISLSLLLAYD